ncbi:MAG: hypothetical protein ACI8P3_000535 [Saprospiraceae bacterium]|jgi:hypothetical protein
MKVDLLNLLQMPRARKTAFYFLGKISSKSVQNYKLFEPKEGLK